MTRAGDGGAIESPTPVGAVATAGGPIQSRTSGPDLVRLRRIAGTVLVRHGSAPGLDIDDLIHAGWLACADAMSSARTATYPYERARYAMLDELRQCRWYRKVGKGTRGGVWVRPRWTRMRIEDVAAGGHDAITTLTEDQRSDLRSLFARLLHPTEEHVMCGLLLDGDSLPIIADRCGTTEQHLRVRRSHACRKILTFLAAACVALMALPARAQTATIQFRNGPAVGELHAPIIRFSLGHMSYSDTSATWNVGAHPIALAVATYQQDSASLPVEMPQLVWTSIRPSVATLSSAGMFACKKRGDARVRVRWVEDGQTIAADSTVILCR